MLTIKPFVEKYLGEAAQLFVANYKLLRQENPLLPEKYEEQQVIIPLIRNLADETGGVVALKEDLLVGYMLGFRIPYFKGTSYGAYCPEWGHAAIVETKPDIYHQMYRHISRQWVANGCFTHAFTFLGHEKEMLDTFFENGFGLLVIDAIRSVDVIGQDFPSAFTIRPAGPDDATTVSRLEYELQRHLAGSPIFLLEDEPTNVAELRRGLSEKTKKVWLAFAGDKPVAYLQAEASAFGAAQIVSDTHTVSITGAYTLPEYRGRGIAVTLLNELLVDAAANGSQRCSVDFESANLEGKHFWLAHFKPVCYSVIRRLDENIAWANSRFKVYQDEEQP
ncbi:MAG: GNAT family N-acetyltransferase [Anaerolineae bacterium]|nr:GNAT family N-acetyltransferase [Anaerolineae bacterium]